VLESYRSDFISTIDQEAISKAGFKVVVDYANGGSSMVFPTVFSQLGINLVALNAYIDPRKFSHHKDERQQSIVQLSSIVKTLHADIGFLINPAAEKLTVVDENGQLIDSQLLLLIMTDLFLRTHTVKRIAVPVVASMGGEEIAGQYNVEVIRVRNSHLAMMEALQQGGVDYVGGTLGGFIFPGFQMGSDAIVSAVYLLNMLAKIKIRLSEHRKKFEGYIRKQLSIPCLKLTRYGQISLGAKKVLIIIDSAINLWHLVKIKGGHPEHLARSFTIGGGDYWRVQVIKAAIVKILMCRERYPRTHPVNRPECIGSGP